MKKNKLFLTIVAIFTFSFSFIISSKTADLVAFSYNRPIQLYALLESIETYVEGLEEIHVIYRASDDNYEAGYQEVKNSFPGVIFWGQGASPRHDFKPLTLKAAFESPSEYVIFAVDDIIVKDFIDIPYAINLLEETRAYGFFYRLGLHLTECYPLNRAQSVPPVKYIIDDVYAWIFKNGQYDWKYPHTVDMTLYRKKDIEGDLKSIGYKAPNSLEGNWSIRANRGLHKEGLCHEETKIVNLPLNLVQTEFRNRTMNAFSAKQLLEKFNDGLKIDIHALFKVKNKAAHMDYVPTFIPR